MNQNPSSSQSSPNKTFIFKEQFDPALIPALYKNFRDPIQAILEIVDNAVDDIQENKKMVITVDLEKDHITFVNKGGLGMGPKELDAFFVWGRSNKRGKLGRYGQGGKAAMGYLGKSWMIRTTKAGDTEEYVIKEDDWDERKNGRLKEYKPQIKKLCLLMRGLFK